MKIIRGLYNSAKVFTDNIDDACAKQVQEICDLEAFKDTKIRIMPDCHLGKGVCIGFTQTVSDKIAPSFVGCDIGCGMTAQIYNKKNLPEIDFEKLDGVIRNNVPYGYNVHDKAHEISNEIALHNIRCPSINMSRARKSIGTLGGGNHFIEINEDKENFYLVIHSGSRHLGLETEEYYSERIHKVKDRQANRELIEKMKASGEVKDIKAELERVKSERQESHGAEKISYLQGQDFADYLNDMDTVQKFASLNRKAIIGIISAGMRLPAPDGGIETIHNYVDIKNMIIRKGAVSAKSGEKLIIPINMRDGSLICCGKGNDDWNCSAPHGAGRILSRTQAEKQLKLEEFKETMKDVWTTSVGENTLSEAPMAYKSMDEIIENIRDSVEIISVVKPLYNFKAPEEDKFWRKKKK